MQVPKVTTDSAFSRVAVAMLLAVTAAACGGSTTDTPADTAPPVVVLGANDLGVARLTDVASGVVISGTLDPSEVVQVKAQVPGTIQQLTVDRGVRVRRGQRIAVIQAEGIRSQVSGAEAGVASAKSGVAAAEANLAAARQRFEGARTLHEAGAMSTVDFQNAQAQYEAAVGQLAAAQAQVAAAQSQLVGASETARRTTVEAPITGVVSERRVNEGEAVNAGQDLLTIVNSEILELSGQVPVQQASAVHVGQTVTFTLDAYPGQEFSGTVARIDPVADPTTRRVGIALRLPNPGSSIVAGQYVTGRVSSANVRRAVMIPRTALRGEAGSQYVLAIEGDTVTRRPVTVEPVDDTSMMVPVQSGVEDGDRVIVSPAVDIQVGAKVRTTNGQAARETK